MCGLSRLLTYEEATEPPELTLDTVFTNVAGRRELTWTLVWEYGTAVMWELATWLTLLDVWGPGVGGGVHWGESSDFVSSSQYGYSFSTDRQSDRPCLSFRDLDSEFPEIDHTGFEIISKTVGH